MRYAAAYVLATLGGNANPDVETISTILGSVGIECDKAKAQKVVDACKGKNVDQIIEEGTKKLSSLPAGGGAVAASAPAAGGAAPAAAGAADAKKGGAKEEAKKEEKKKEESDEEEGDMVCPRSSFQLNTNFSFSFPGIWLIRLDPPSKLHIQHPSYSLRLFFFACVCVCVLY